MYTKEITRIVLDPDSNSLLFIKVAANMTECVCVELFNLTYLLLPRVRSILRKWIFSENH